MKGNAMSNELIERLRTHDDERLYQEADVLMSEAADTIERLQLELSSKESSIGTISHALSYAEKECSRHNMKSQELENENRRLKLDLDEARKQLDSLAWESHSSDNPALGPRSLAYLRHPKR